MNFEIDSGVRKLSMCGNGLADLNNKFMYRVYVICANLDWNASCEQRSLILKFKSKIDFQYCVEYFAAKRREKVNKDFLFSPTKTNSRRNFSVFRGEISPIETRNLNKFIIHFAEKKHHMFAEKREKKLFFSLR